MGTANLALLKQFARQPDLEIDVVTSALGGRSDEEQFSERIRIYKVPVWNQNLHHSSNRELSLYAGEALVLSLALARKKDYDFCFAWSVLPAGAVALALKKLARLPYMVWVSGPDIPGFEQRYQGLYPRLLPLIRRVWRSAAPVIAKCREEVDMIHAVDPDLPVEVIRNGAELQAFLPHTPNDRAARPLHGICVARLIERKGQHHLIQAVRKLKDEGIEVVVSLLGTGDALESNQHLAKELGVADQVRFLGYVPREDLPLHYAAADVFVLPSYNEGMALAALEAMAGGVPLILTRTGGTAELVEHGVNGFIFDWAAVDQMAAHLSYCAQNRDALAAMGQASRARAEYFSWECISAEYLRLFERMPARARPLEPAQ
jgi:phosphatidyl-myo-inositol dimannoside synthase